MTTKDFPANLVPSSIQFGLQSNTQVFKSPLSSSTQTLRMPSASWYGKASFTDLIESDWRTLASFVTSLEGMHGRFYFGDFGGVEPRGAISASSNTLRINGASQTGATIAVDGFPASTSNVFRTGDYIAYDTTAGRELKMITADATSNSSGEATLSIAPNIRTSPADNAVVSYRTTSANGLSNTDLTCIVRLEEDQSAWNVAPPLIGTISFTFIEAFA